MQQVISVWAGLDGRRRIVVMVATLAMFASVMALTRIASSPGLTLLYAGLEASTAGDVVAALEQRGLKYDVRGGAIYVEGSRRDELRMTLASEGLPASGGAGYELLDSLSGFGTTSQMFDAAYWRAKEGELARTIVASPAVRNARVHIANSSGQSFRRDISPSASVTITPAGSGLSAGHARALRNLVASAVAGLNAENVSVIDSTNGQVIGAEDAGNRLGGDDKAVELKEAVSRLLEARVGPGNAVVEVSVETVTEQESIIERTIDPDSRVAISTDTTETSNNSEDSRSGGVSVASNLPEGDAAGAGGSSNARNSETRERTNFEISETQREVLRKPGAIRRISVAVLVNGVSGLDDAGETVFTPRSDEELAVLRDLVASAVGFIESRGDVIAIRSLQFEPVFAAGTEPISGLFQGMHIDIMTIIQLVVLAVAAVLLGIFVVKPILTAPLIQENVTSSPASLPAPVAGNENAPAIPEFNTSPPPGALPELPGQILTGEIDNSFVPGGMSVVDDFDLPEDFTGGDPVARLKDMIEDRQEEAVEVLRSWMEDPKEAT